MISAKNEVSCNTGSILSGVSGKLDSQLIDCHFENVKYLNSDTAFVYNQFHDTMGLKNGLAGPKCKTS